MGGWYSKYPEGKYSVWCDIHPRICCSKVLLSEYQYAFSYLQFVPKGHFLDLQLSHWGLVFYLGHVLFPVAQKIPGLGRIVKYLFLIATITVAILSVYLAQQM